MAIAVNRSLSVQCPKCHVTKPVELFLSADDMKVDCNECGARICTMGDLIDQTVRIVADKLGAGLKHRSDRTASNTVAVERAKG